MNAEFVARIEDYAARIRALEAENTRLREALAIHGRPADAAAPSLAPVQSILDHFPSLIGCWDKDLRYRYANQAYRDWFGIGPEAMPGRHLREVIGEERYRLNLPYIEAALRGEPQMFEREIPTPDGREVRHALAHYIPDIQNGEVNGFFVLVSDVTAVKQADLLRRQNQALLEENEQLYRSVVQDQTELISRLRGDGTYLFANDVYCRFFGLNPKEVPNSRWQPVVYPEDVHHVNRELAALSPANPVVMIENRVISAAGTVHWMQFSNRGTFDAQGTLLEIQSVGRDITDRKRAEASLQQAHEELQRRVIQLRQLAVDATLAEERERRAIAHDLHDDLGQLLHIARLKLDAHAKRCPQADAALAEVSELVADASRMVRSLTSQISPPALHDLGLSPALRWLAGELERQYGLDVTILDDEQPKPLPPAVGAMVFRAVRELLINVAKHAGVPRAELRVSTDAQRIHVAVRDEGCGLSAEGANDDTTSRGLTSVRERIGFLGGEFSIRSAPNAGTCVAFSIPLRNLLASAAPPPTP